jgi:hypothetical protein
VFQSGDGHDTITDFVAGEGAGAGVDEVQLVGFALTAQDIAAALADETSAVIQDDGADNTVVQPDALNPADTILLVGVTKSTLAASDFVLS